MIIKKFKKCFNQLDVIHDLKRYDYKNASILKELCDNKLTQLSKCRRSDDTLFNLINFDNIPNLKKSDFDNKVQKLIFAGPMKQENLLIRSICK